MTPAHLGADGGGTAGGVTVEFLRSLLEEFRDQRKEQERHWDEQIQKNNNIEKWIELHTQMEQQQVEDHRRIARIVVGNGEPGLSLRVDRIERMISAFVTTFRWAAGGGITTLIGTGVLLYLIFARLGSLQSQDPPSPRNYVEDPK